MTDFAGPFVMLLLRAFLTRKERQEGSGPEETIEHA